MTTRYNSGDPFGVPSGYAGANIPEKFELPSVGVEDVDRAMFDFFDKDLKLHISNGRSGEVQKIPVVFAAGERWAMLKKNRALRDKSGTLILPLTTIRRMDIQQDVATDIAGRGINQQTGELVIKRQLSPLDRSYQNLINKLGIVNQSNVADSTTTLLTERKTGENAVDSDGSEGGLLASKFGNNVWEIITIPAPQFFTVTYEITFWTQHMQHMNQIVDKIMSSYLPTANGTWKLETPKGYWFVAKVQDNLFTAADNAENITGEERVIRSKMTVKVPAYQVASTAPGIPKPIRRFVSAPIVSFPTSEELDSGIPSTYSNPEDISNDPSAMFSLGGELQPRELAARQSSPSKVTFSKNPFTGRTRAEYVRIVTRNAKNGEAILHPTDYFSIGIVSSGGPAPLPVISSIPQNALLTEDLSPLLTEASDYIVTEENV
jgi:hypothetical protein